MEAQQVSFIVAAVFIAVLFADRLGGSAALARRIYQVSLGLILALAVVAGTDAFIRPPEIPLDRLTSSDFLTGSPPGDLLQPDILRDYANRVSESTTVRAAFAILALVGGIAMIERWRTTGLGVATGGLILALFSGSGVGRGECTNPYNSAGVSLGFSTENRDIAQFVVLLAGTLILAWYGARRWDTGAEAEPDPAATVDV